MLGRQQSMWQLEHVDLTGCSLITDTTLQRISQAITTSPPALHSTDNAKGGKKEWKEEACVEPKLNSLILSGCHLITDVGLRYVS